jgi:hypothetical protein
MDDRQDEFDGDESAATPVEGAKIETLEQTPRSEQAVRRREVLALHLEQLEETQRSGTDLQEALAGLDLEAWELEQLGQGLAGASNYWRDLVVEGVAFQNKCQTDIGWGPGVQQLSVEELNDFREILITDATLGFALLEESQRAVNRLIRDGEMGIAKKLTNFRNKIAQSVHDVKGIIGEKGYAEATENGEALVAPEEPAAWTEQEPRQATPMRQHTPTPSAGRAAGRIEFKQDDSKRHIKPLLMLLGLLFVVWGVYIVPTLQVKTLQPLSVNDVSHASEIRYVLAKPPSLFVELDSHAWRALSKTERLGLIDDVGKTASAAGYNGAHFKLENGKTAGRWLKQGGSRLID